MIVDGGAATRSRLAAGLASAPDLTVIGESDTPGLAVSFVASERPDVVLLDAALAGPDGAGAAAPVTAAVTALPGVPVRVLVLTEAEPTDHVFAALRAGASGYLRKDSATRTLTDAVRLVAAGQGVGDPVVTARLASAYAGGAVAVNGGLELAQLTERELDVLRLAARGLSNAEVAAELVLSTSTVKTHMNAILGKLKLRDRVQATIIAYETGLIRPGSDPGAGWGASL
jgi:DNA-binding NarL/FixJ family response regulator